MGQGVVAVKATVAIDSSAELLFAARTDDPGDPVLYLHITPTSCELRFGSDIGTNLDGGFPQPNGVQIDAEAIQGPSACYLVPGDTITYWLSIDKDNGILQYGSGYINTHNILLKVTLKKEVGRILEWAAKEFAWLGKLTTVNVYKGGADQVRTMMYMIPDTA